MPHGWLSYLSSNIISLVSVPDKRIHIKVLYNQASTTLNKVLSESLEHFLALESQLTVLLHLERVSLSPNC